MSDWKDYKIGEIAEIKGGKRLPKGDLLVNYETPHPYIRVTDIGNKWIRKTGLQFVTPEIQKSISRYIVNSGNVILSIVGSIGFVGRIPDELDGANLTENCVKFLTNKNLVDDDFLYYYFKSNIGQGEIEKRNVGSTQPKLPIYNIKDIDILIPPLPEQKAIAEVLSVLDDKIDLLHRQNKTLEQIAETLFRKWFIEGAKEEWEMFKVKDIAIHKKDSVNPSKNPFVEYKHFSLPAFDSGKRPQIELGSTIHSNKYIVHQNSILVSKLNPRIPRIWLNLNNVDENCICSTEFQVIKPKETEYLGFLFCLLKSDDAIAELEMSASGTSGSHQRVRPEDILNLGFNTPSIDRIIEFSKHVEPLLAKTVTNHFSINNLEQQRDTLLPKLMSGEVRVKLD